MSIVIIILKFYQVAASSDWQHDNRRQKVFVELLGPLAILNGLVVIGSLEVLGGLGLIIGIWVPWLAALASTGLALIMVGAVLSLLRTRAPLQKVAFPLLVGVLAVVVAVSYWPVVLHG